MHDQKTLLNKYSNYAQVQRDTMRNQECNPDLERMSIFLDDIVKFIYRIVKLVERQKMYDVTTECSSSLEYLGVFDPSSNVTCDSMFTIGKIKLYTLCSVYSI